MIDMTPARLAEIRAVLNGDQSVDMDDALPIVSKAADDLLDEVDRLRAENDNLRAGAKSFVRQIDRLANGIEALARDGEAYGRGNALDLSRRLRALLNPTEGEDR